MVAVFIFAFTFLFYRYCLKYALKHFWVFPTLGMILVAMSLYFYQDDKNFVEHSFSAMATTTEMKPVPEEKRSFSSRLPGHDPEVVATMSFQDHAGAPHTAETIVSEKYFKIGGTRILYYSKDDFQVTRLRSDMWSSMFLFSLGVTLFFAGLIFYLKKYLPQKQWMAIVYLVFILTICFGSAYCFNAYLVLPISPDTL